MRGRDSRAWRLRRGGGGGASCGRRGVQRGRRIDKQNRPTRGSFIGRTLLIRRRYADEGENIPQGLKPPIPKVSLESQADPRLKPRATRLGVPRSKDKSSEAMAKAQKQRQKQIPCGNDKQEEWRCWLSLPVVLKHENKVRPPVAIPHLVQARMRGLARV